MFFVFLTFFIWSTSFTIGKATLECAPPVFLTGARMFFAGLVLLAFLAVFRRGALKITKRQFWPLLLLSLTAVYLTNVLEFWGLQYLTAAKACFIYSLSPFLSALFSYFQFKEKITPRKLLGLCIGFVGFLPVMWNHTADADVFFLSWADLALVGATTCAVYGWVLLRKLGKEEGMSPIMANGASMCLGGGIALLHSLLVDSWHPTPIVNYTGFFKGIFLMILVSNLICYNLYGWLLKRFTATFLSFSGLMTPLFAAFFGWVFLKETVSWHFFLSMGIVSLGLWLVYAEELRLGYILKQKERSVLTPSP